MSRAAGLEDVLKKGSPFRLSRIFCYAGHPTID
jgi:hypothetical protein